MEVVISPKPWFIWNLGAPNCGTAACFLLFFWLFLLLCNLCRPSADQIVMPMWVQYTLGGHAMCGLMFHWRIYRLIIPLYPWDPAPSASPASASAASAASVASLRTEIQLRSTAAGFQRSSAGSAASTWIFPKDRPKIMRGRDSKHLIWFDRIII
jgi:hypothetical protein